MKGRKEKRKKKNHTYQKKKKLKSKSKFIFVFIMRLNIFTVYLVGSLRGETWALHLGPPGTGNNGFSSNIFERMY